MNRRTKSDWQALFNEHKQSGLTAVAFCQERNLNPKHFCLRRKQLQPKNEEKATSAFTPMTLPISNSTSMIELQVNEAVKLHIPQTISPSWLVDLIHQLQA
jgi:hypothetical protein